MNKYSKKSQEQVEKTMHKMNEGKLKSGKDGKGGTVKSREQAVAIGLSEARKKGYKAPEKSSTTKSQSKKTKSE